MLIIERSAYSPRALLSSHISSVGSVLNEIDLEAVQRVVQILRNARNKRATVYIAGNGGSASTASHWVNDLGKATKRSGRHPFRVMSLSDNTSWFSALGNDEGYEHVFAGQLDNFANSGDVLICISASGNSPNLMRAVDVASRRGVTTIALLGFDGGELKSLVDEAVLIQTPKGMYELVEDAHSVVAHAITRCLVADYPEAGE